MVAVSLFAQARVLAASVAALASMMSATPALANSSAAADIMAPLRVAQASKQNDNAGDEEFRRLFSGWVAGGQAAVGQSGVAAPTPRVAIPSLTPVGGVRLSSDFGMRVHPVLGGRRQHKGVDLAGPTGTPVHATADGVVSRADWFSSYGLYVSLEHGAEIETRYGHMSRLNVVAGQIVHKGDVIGYVGSTGRSTGPHLHYEVRIAGNAVNPIPYLQEETPAELAVNTGEPMDGQGGPE